MNQSSISEIFDRFASKNAAPIIELDYDNNPFRLLVAVLLSAQSTDIAVNKATKVLFLVYDTPQKMFLLGEAELKKYIKSIGLYNNKAKNIIALAELLISKYEGKVPSSFEELITLPGIGIKSANVILNVLFGVSTIAVDTHVFRVSNRVGLVKARSVLDTEAQLKKVIPEDRKFFAHRWLVLHGRYICKARRPLCHQCLINDLCLYQSKTLNT